MAIKVTEDRIVVAAADAGETLEVRRYPEWNQWRVRIGCVFVYLPAPDLLVFCNALRARLAPSCRQAVDNSPAPTLTAEERDVLLYHAAFCEEDEPEAHYGPRLGAACSLCAKGYLLPEHYAGPHVCEILWRITPAGLARAEALRKE